jgi:hypothetical protein
MNKLKPGDRIETNAAFARMFPRDRILPKTGVIVAPHPRTDKRFKVLWDGWQQPEMIHVSFLELAEGGVNG